LNVTAGAHVTNHVQVASSATGEVCVWVSSPMEVAVDLTGWFGATATTEFHSIVPARVVDTRFGRGGRTGVVPANTAQPFAMAGVGGLPAAGVVQAPFATVTVVTPTSIGYLTVYACQATPPAVSMVRYLPGLSASTAVTGPDDASGRWCVRAVTAVNVVIDVSGWFA
jgi:hypothetical protein